MAGHKARNVEVTREISKRIRRARIRKKLTIREASELLGIPASTLTGLEVNSKQIASSYLPVIAGKYKIPITDLLPGEHEIADKTEAVIQRLRYEYGKLALDGRISLREMVVLQQMGAALDQVEEEYRQGVL